MGVHTLERQQSVVENYGEKEEQVLEAQEAKIESDILESFSERFAEGVENGQYNVKEITQWTLDVSNREDLNDNQKAEVFHGINMQILDAIQDLQNKKKSFVAKNQGGEARKKQMIEQVSKAIDVKVSELQGLLQEIRDQQQKLESVFASSAESGVDVEHTSRQTLEMLAMSLDKTLEIDPGNIEALLEKQKVEDAIVERLGMKKGEALPHEVSVDSIVAMMQIDEEFSGSAAKKSRIRTGDNQAILSERAQDLEAQRKGSEVESLAAAEIAGIDGVVGVIELPQDSVADHREVTDLLVLTLKEEFRDVLDEEDIRQMISGLSWKIRREANRMSQKLGIDVRADVYSSYGTSAEKNLFEEKLQDLEEALEYRKIQIKSSIEGLQKGYDKYEDYHSRNPGQDKDVGFLSYRDESRQHSKKWFQQSAKKVLGIN